MSEILLHSKLRELEDDLKNEREYRLKFEKELTSVKMDFDDMETQFQEAINAKDREVESGKRLRQEIADLKQKIDNQQHASEESSALIRRKHQETIAELTSHLEVVNKAKFKFEKDYKQYFNQNEDLKKENEMLLKAKSTVQIQCKDFENKYHESTRRLEDVVRQLGEANDSKAKLLHSNNEHTRKTLAVDHELQQLTLNNKKITQELDDARMALETESLVRSTLDTKNKNMQNDLDALSAQLDEESEIKLDLQKQLAKLQDEFRCNKERIEKECGGKLDEYEEFKRKMNGRLTDLQDQVTTLESKYSTAEKARQKLQNQVTTLTADCDSYKKRVDESIKIEKVLNKEVEDMRTRFVSISNELETSYTTARLFSNDLTKQKNINEQLTEQVDAFSKDKRRQSDEMELLSNQLLDSQSKIADLERKIKTLDSDRQQAENELEDSKDAHQAEVSKNQALQMQFDKLKSENDRRLQEKEDEIDLQKTAIKRQQEQAQLQLDEAENRHKADLTAFKKKTAGELEELRNKVDESKKSKTDAESNLKKLQQTNKELTDKLTEEEHLHDETSTQLTLSDKKLNALKAELEETKALLERSEKSRKVHDSDYLDLEEKLSEAQNALNKALAERKKLESDAAQASDELQELKYELKSSDEKGRHLSIAIAKKDEELRSEKEYTYELESNKKQTDIQIKELQSRLEESEEITKREAKKITIELKSRMIELESELDAEKAKEVEYVNTLRRMEKRNKDLVDRINEDQAKLIHYSEAYNKIFEKAKKYKAQIAGVEEQVQATETKCKRLQRELEDADERAESVAKSFIRSGSVSSRMMEPYDSDYGDSDQISLNQFSGGSVINMPTAYRSYLKGDEFTGGPPSVLDRSSRGPSVSSWRQKSVKPLDFDDDDLALPPRNKQYPAYNNQPKTSNRAMSTSRSDRSRSVSSFYDFDSISQISQPTQASNKQRIDQYYRYNNSNGSTRSSALNSTVNSTLNSGRNSARNSVSRLEDEDLMMDSASLVESFRSKYNRSSTSKLLEKYAAEKNENAAKFESKYETKLNDLEQRLSSATKKNLNHKETSIIEKKMMLGSEHSDGENLENLETPESRTPENLD